MVLPCKNKEEGGSARALPVAAPMPKSVSLLREKKESLDCLVLAYLSVVERPCIYSECSPSLTVIRGLSHWRVCVLI